MVTIFEEAANYLVEDMKPLHKDSDPGEKEKNLLEIWNQFFEHVAEHARMAGQHGSNIMVMSLHWQDTSFDGNGNG